MSFAFSHSPELGAHGLLTEPVRIEFIRKEESTLSMTKFTYNTIMSFSFNSTITSYYDLCAFDHEWGETREYITPGSEERLSLRRCLRCDFEEHLCDPYSDGEVYKVTVKEGGPLLAEPIVKRHKSGTLVEILVTHNDGKYPMLVANGVMIPVCTESDGVISYRFLMPCDHVTVSIMEFSTWPPIVEEEKTEFTLAELAPWMSEIEATDVAAVTVTDDIPDASPMSFIPHATVSGEDAAALFALYRDTRFTDTKGDLPDVLGTLRTLTFTLVSGESYTLTLRGAIFETADGAYSASELPSIPDGATVTTSYSFASPDSAACSVYANDGENTYLGAIADISVLEFVSLPETDVPDSDATSIIKTGRGDLLVLSDDVFCMITDGMVMKYYRVINGSIFDYVN